MDIMIGIQITNRNRLMKKAQLLHIMSDDDEEASEEGEAGIPNLTDFTIPVTVTDSEDTTTTTGSYMTATDFSSDESHIDNE
ncbi:hypothetical protein Ocin01_05188 [Orchesella cincta]|uniref:Uncharacterized protein n=1 Tax=Orchesella cincta TaxID=48709 RepID=A0A1D2N8S3_ORCCI|nr:hypothetical protein Ocin01_05188 [Orchesella cincta]